MAVIDAFTLAPPAEFYVISTPAYLADMNVQRRVYPSVAGAHLVGRHEIIFDFKLRYFSAGGQELPDFQPRRGQLRARKDLMVDGVVGAIVRSTETEEMTGKLLYPKPVMSQYEYIARMSTVLPHGELMAMYVQIADQYGNFDEAGTYDPSRFMHFMLGIDE